MRTRLSLVVALFLALTLATPALTDAQAFSLTIAADCESNPERVTITNNLATTLNVASIGSIDDPRANEPFTPPSSGLPFEVPVGGSLSFTSGSAASGNVLTRQFIFDDEEAGEGVVVSIGPEGITGPDGPLAFRVLCDQGDRTFAFVGAMPRMPNTGAGGMVEPQPLGAGLAGGALLGALTLGGAAAIRRRKAA